MIKYLFIYNAKSGTINTVLDNMHKLFAPNTFQCNLCKITFGPVKERPEWKEFREQYGEQFRFLHSDEFEDEYPDRPFTYPIILKEEEGDLEALLCAEAINECDNTLDLINLVTDNMA